ncbi:MAG: response regulator [Candidatus Pacebacteria bacterium]|nr:response regulator [Candidatus Paceibacterota bacterium]
MITFDVINLILSLGLVIIIGLSLAVLIFRFKSFSSKLLFLQGFFFSLWILFVIFLRSDNNLDQFTLSMFISASLFVASLASLLFAYFFPFVDKKRAHDIAWLWLAAALGIVVFAFIFVPDIIISSTPSQVYNGYFYDVYWIFTLLFIVLSIFYFLRKYFSATNIEKAKIFYASFNYIILLVAICVFNLLLPKFGIMEYYWVGALSTVIIFSGNIYTVVVKRFVNFRIAFKKIFIFIGAGLFSYLAYFGVSSLLLSLFGEIFVWQSYVVGAFLAIIFAYLFHANDYLFIKLANRYFFVDLYKYQKNIDKLIYDLTTHVHTKEIVEITIESIANIVESKEVRMFLSPRKQGACQGDGKIKGLFYIKPTSHIYRFLKKTQEILITDELELLCREKNLRGEKNRLLKELQEENIHLALPLIIKKDFIGFIALDKKSLNFTYNTNDLNLLKTLIRQVAIAVERSLLYCQLEEQSETLKDFNKALKKRVKDQTRDINEKNVRLQELLGLKKDFLRVVNHQLNTPISIIKNSFAMIDDGTFSAKEGLVYAKAGLDRIDNTINDFWQAFAWEGEDMELNLEPDNIFMIIKNILESKQEIEGLKDKALKLSLKKPNFKMPLVYCDKKNIVHVISNLLDNAINYTPKGEVEISFEKTKDKLKVLIKDTGIGMTQDEARHVFEKFSRGEGAVSLNPDGSGLGLYIANKIIRAHKNKLNIENTAKNKGTTFSFSLDIAKIPTTNKKKSEKANKQLLVNKKSQGARVFMVEDEINLVKMYERYFQKNNYQFAHSFSAQDAYREAIKYEPDIIILDIIIPKTSKGEKINPVAEQGWELLSLFKSSKSTKDVPLIVFTNLNSLEDRKKAEKLGADEFIFKEETKPEQLLKTINKLI